MNMSQTMKADCEVGGSVLVIIIIGIILLVGYLDYSEGVDRYDHCIFESFPDESVAAKKKCARRSGFQPMELTTGGVK